MQSSSSATSSIAVSINVITLNKLASRPPNLPTMVDAKREYVFRVQLSHQGPTTRVKHPPPSPPAQQQSPLIDSGSDCKRLDQMRLRNRKQIMLRGCIRWLGLLLSKSQLRPWMHSAHTTHLIYVTSITSQKDTLPKYFGNQSLKAIGHSFADMNLHLRYTFKLETLNNFRPF